MNLRSCTFLFLSLSECHWNIYDNSTVPFMSHAGHANAPIWISLGICSPRNPWHNEPDVVWEDC